MDIFVNANLLRYARRFLDRSSPMKAHLGYTMSKPLCPIGTKNVKPLVRAVPERVGIPSSVVSAFLDEAVNECGLDLHGVTIVKHGKIICEAELGPYRPEYYHVCHSLSKSVTAMAIGMLIDEGKLSLDSKVTKLIEKRVPKLSILGYRSLTVRHLLTMTSGASFAESGVVVEKNWLKAFFESTAASSPGKKFNYNSLNTYVLSCIVKEVSGEGLCKYLKNRLFAPLGITKYHWELSPEGIECGGWGLYLTREDMAKLGLLYLNNGIYDGKRIISESWVKMSTMPWIKTPDEYGMFEYGYHVWADKDRKSFLFNGMFCQDVLVLKEQKIVIATNGCLEQLFQQSCYYDLIFKYFDVPSLRPIPRVKKLSKLLRELKNGGNKRRILPPKLPHDIKKNIGVIYRADDYSKNPLKGVQKKGNPLSCGVLPIAEQLLRNTYATGIRSMTLVKDGSALLLEVEETEGIKRIPVTLDKWTDTVLQFGSTYYRASAFSTVSKNEDGITVLKIKLAFPEVASARVIKLYFGKDSVYVTMSEKPGMEIVRIFADVLEETLKKKKLLSDVVSLIDADAIFLKLERRFEPKFTLNRNI
ncbi:MAG: serine hydrolase [Ruminococcaceae bacterium]|nr:serine hydrolase [Oscillospiraceae bacterium]